MYRFLHANILLSGTFLIAAMVGCSSSTETATNTGTSTGQTQAGSSDASKPLRIAVIPKGTSHEFWKSVHFGAQKAADEIGDVEIIWRGPVVESDTGSQIEVVKNMIPM